MFKKFSKYFLIGLCSVVLLAAAQQGLFNKNSGFVLADSDPRCGQDGSKCHDSAGCVGNISVWGTWDEDGNLIKEIERVGEVPGQCGNSVPSCSLTPTLNECTGCNKANTVSIDCNGNRIKTGETTDSACSGPQWGCPAPVLTCGGSNPDRTNPEPNCNKLGAPQGLCCTICGNGNCDRFNGENESNCSSDCAPRQAPVTEPDCSSCGNNNQPACTGVCHDRIGNCRDGFIKQSDGICRVPQQPPASTCRSISCSSAPANCAFSGQVTSSCDPNVSLTCGTLTCTQVPPAGGTTNNNTNGGATNNNNNCTGSNSCSGGGATVTVTNPTPQVVLAAAPALVTVQNVGVGTSVVSAPVLPKTGLPILAWSALAFIPAGFKMKGISRVKKALGDHPSFIWENRQFRNGS